MTTREDPTELVEVSDEPAGPEATHGHAPASERPRVVASNFLMHPDTHPAILDMALLDKLGAEWLLWESETFARALPGLFGAPSVSKVNVEKIDAMRTLHANDAFWTRWEVFVWCAMALNGIPADFEVMQKPTVPQVAVAVAISQLVRDDIELSDEVKQGIRVVCAHDHVVCPPAPLEWVHHDITEYDVNDTAIRRAWAAYLISRRVPTEETVEAVQVRHMSEIDAYVKEFERRLRVQTPLLRDL